LKIPPTGCWKTCGITGGGITTTAVGTSVGGTAVAGIGVATAFITSGAVADWVVGPPVTVTALVVFK
jgi:hypothetical protein